MNGIHDCAWTDCLISERIDTVLRHHHLLPPADIKPCRLELVIKTFPEAGFQRWGPLTCFHKVLCSLLFLKFKSLFFFYISYIFISIHIYVCIFFFLQNPHPHAAKLSQHILSDVTQMLFFKSGEANTPATSGNVTWIKCFVHQTHTFVLTFNVSSHITLKWEIWHMQAKLTRHDTRAHFLPMCQKQHPGQFDTVCLLETPPESSSIKSK